MDRKAAEIFARIEEKLDQHGMSAREASLLAVGKPDLIRDLKRQKGTPSADRLQSLADVLGTSVEWLLRGGDDIAARDDLARTRVLTEVRAAGVEDVRREFRGEKPQKALPLIGTAMAGEHEGVDSQVELIELDLSDVLDYLNRPASLANDPDAYAVTILSDSMSPWVEPGNRVAVSPRSPIAIGDYVLVQLRGDDDRIRLVLIKRLVRRKAGTIELCQYRPEKTFSIDARRVAHMHKVVGVLW